MPGVSTKTICASGVVTTPWIDVRVVCGLSATMATFCPTRAFSRVDFPAFGRPTRDTNPERNGWGNGGLALEPLALSAIIGPPFAICGCGPAPPADRRWPALRRECRPGPQ